jgi:predicted metal-dependent hydrolase
MAYFKNQNYKPDDAHELLLTARTLVDSAKITIRDLRISTMHIEIDVSVHIISDLEKAKSRLLSLGEFIEADEVHERILTKEDAISLARELFNSEKYWSTHEVLEGVWKISTGEEKDLLNGIILVAAAMVHFQKNEIEVGISILKRAKTKLSKSKFTYYTIDMDLLKKNITQLIKTSNIEIFTI